MSAQHHRRRTALATALTAVAGCVALVLAGPAHATFPGRNGLIAFYSSTDQGAQIFTVRPNGRDLRQITHVSGDAADVDWSPDGRRIAFDIETPDSVQIAIMNADGSGLVTLPKAPGNIIEVDPSFTPDGRRLVFLTNNGGDDAIWSMKLDGTDRRLIKTGGASDPNVSPDGRRIAFVSFNGEPFGTALSTSSIDGSEPLPAHALQLQRGLQARLGPRRPPARLHPQRRPRSSRTPPSTSRRSARTEPACGLSPTTATNRSEPCSAATPPMAVGSCSASRPTASSACTRSTPTEHTSAPILGLSDFAPRFIDWGASTQHGDDGPGDGDQDDGDRQDGESHR